MARVLYGGRASLFIGVASALLACLIALVLALVAGYFGGITDPTAANKIWAQVDHETTDQAPWVALYNPKYIDFLSARVKGYQFSPQWYFLLGQASVK